MPACLPAVVFISKTLCVPLASLHIPIKSVEQTVLQKYLEVQNQTSSSTRRSPTSITELVSFVWSFYSLYAATLSTRDLYFMCQGKPCHEDALLSDYALSSSWVQLEVNYRQRGGCFMVSASIVATISALLLLCPCTCGASLILVPFLLPLLFILPFFCL
jgi:ABC-type phosphate transport system permease subunit